MQHGDIWLNTSSTNLDQTPGTYGYLTMIHEIGHALGLKHPFTGSVRLPTAQDNYSYTVMSYTAPTNNGTITVSGTASNYSWIYNTLQPRTPMLYDIAALQYLYGANTTTRSGSTTYSWGTSEAFFETIWDGGGTDTIDLSNQTLASRLDLRPGTLSSIAMRQTTAERRVGLPVWATQIPTPTYDGVNNLGIAAGVMIENAIGGGGNDTITGNAAGNTLSGGGGDDMLDGAEGDDTLEGSAGNDALIGGTGTDTAVFGSGTLVWKDGTGAYRASGPDGEDQLSGIELVRIGAGGATAIDQSLFNPWAYLASYGDLLAAFGANISSAVQHYLNHGRAEGRAVTFDPERYIASYTDLVRTFGDDPIAGARHYVEFGRTEGRTVLFNAQSYLNRYSDLQAAFGSDTAAAARHYIQYGLAEGRIA